MPINFRIRRRVVEWLALVAVLAAFAAYLAVSLGERHDRAGEVESERLDAHARVIHDNLGQQLHGADHALRVLAADTEYWRGRPGAVGQGPRLKSFSEALLGIRNLRILDAGGRVVASTRGDDVGAELATREFFATARIQRNADLLVVPPPVQTAAGEFELTVSKAIVGSDGSFRGVVAATLDPRQVGALMESVRYAPDVWASIVHGDGLAFLYSPERPELVGKDLAVPGSFFSRHLTSGQMATAMSGVVYATGEARMIAQRTVKPPNLMMDRPLVVAVTRDLDRVYADWRAERERAVTLFLLLAALGAATLGMYHRRQRREEARAAARAEELRIAVERLRLATAAAGLGVWEFDPVSRKLIWDPGMQTIYGVAGDVQTYEEWRSRVVASDLPGVEASLQRAIHDRRPFRSTFRIRRADGEIRTVRALASAIYGDGPEDGALRVIGINEDVTDRWRAEEAVRTSELRLKAVFEILPVGITLSDGEGRVVACNAASEELLGVGREKLQGRLVGDDAFRFRRPDGSPMPAEEFAAVRALASRQPVRNLPLFVETAGGRRWLSVSAMPMGDRQQGVATAYVDISEVRRGEAELRKLSRAVEQAATGIVVTDAEGRIEYVNPAACTAFGYQASELVGKNPSVFKSGKTDAETYRALWATIKAGEVWQGHLTNRRRDGSLVEEAVSISPVRDESGRVTHYVAIKEDVTAEREGERLRRDLEARMVKLGRMEVMGAMAGGVAHDFNNILVAILGFSGLGKSVLKRAGGPPRVISYFEEIETAGERARALVQQLRTFSRGGAMNVESVALDESARQVIKLLGSTLPEHTQIVSEVAPGLPEIAIDRAHLNQILVNLCANARDAVRGEGRVTVSARLVDLRRNSVCDSCHKEFSGEFFRIAVADSGCGMSAEVRSRVFEPFFTTKELGHGTGMGLAVVHGIVHLYHGHVEIVSEPGAGCEVIVYLPRQPAFPESAIHVESAAA